MRQLSPPITRRRALAALGAAGISLPLHAQEESVITRIAFGSCCHQNKPQDIWSTIISQQPEIFLFTGDNIYGDTDDMAILRGKYGQLLAQPDYQKLKQTCRVFATWDDHDYGLNDSGADYPMKVESQKAFLDAFLPPPDRGPWHRPGIYDAHILGPVGRRVQIIMLDTRYFRGPMIKLKPPTDRKFGPYVENTDPAALILGETQWTWLEEQLRQPAELRILVSSFQVLPVDHRWERWQNFPHERQRLLTLLKTTGTKGLIMLSGDRHLAEVMRLPTDDPQSPGFPLYEFTSSGMSHAGGGSPEEPNRYRVGLNYRDLNFGRIGINWDAQAILVSVLNVKGRVVLERRITLREIGAA